MPVSVPVFLQNHVNQCNLLHLMYFNLYWYKQIQMCVNVWNHVNNTHNQGVAGSSREARSPPAGQPAEGGQAGLSGVSGPAFAGEDGSPAGATIQ